MSNGDANVLANRHFYAESAPTVVATAEFPMALDAWVRGTDWTATEALSTFARGGCGWRRGRWRTVVRVAERRTGNGPVTACRGRTRQVWLCAR
jgi:hypothetical protein